MMQVHEHSFQRTSAFSSHRRKDCFTLEVLENLTELKVQNFVFYGLKHIKKMQDVLGIYFDCTIRVPDLILNVTLIKNLCIPITVLLKND